MEANKEDVSCLPFGGPVLALRAMLVFSGGYLEDIFFWNQKEMEGFFSGEKPEVLRYDCE